MIQKLNYLLITAQYKFYDAVRLFGDVTGGDTDGDGDTNVDSFLDGFGQPNENDTVFGGATQAAKTLGNSIYSLLFFVVLIAGVIAILISALKIIAGGNQAMAEGKSKLPMIVLGISLAACAVSIVGIIANGAPQLFSGN